MKFKLEIDTNGNDAFEDEPTEKLAFLVGMVSKRIAAGKDSGICQDYNGNSVGKWEIIEDE